MSLQDLRRQIDAVDDEILKLLSRRAEIAQEVGKNKSKEASQFFRPERERQIFERLTRENPGPFGKDAIKAVWREIISAARALEAPLSAAYLGPPGTFSHRAALDKFGSSSELRPVATIPDVFAEVERGAADYGVVPVENSTEGVVPYTLDMFSQTPLKVCAEVFVPVVHNIGAKAESLKAVKRLYAHPQSLAQSRGWVRDNLPKAEIVDVTSNSKAAQLAAMDSEGRQSAPKSPPKSTASRSSPKRSRTLLLTALASSSSAETNPLPPARTRPVSSSPSATKPAPSCAPWPPSTPTALTSR